MKKIIFAIFVVAFVGSLSVVSAQSKFLTGKYTVNYNNSGYTLDKNTGERSYTMEVNFLNPFEKRPEVVVTISLLDADKGTNVRYNVETTGVSRDGFTLKISTWGDSKIFGLGGTWIAYSE